MNSDRANWLYSLHANALAFVDVEDENRDRSIGSAFHLGDGVFVTARHVVEKKQIIQIRITEPVGIRASELFPDLPVNTIEEWDESIAEVLGATPFYKHWTPPLEIAAGPVFHKNKDVDVAVFRVTRIHNSVGVVLLGIHWDDWVYRGNWFLNDALVMGYPSIPMTSEPHLVAALAQINTFIVPRFSGHVHFILSAVPRGGFSGGPALHEDGYALGLITSSILDGDKPIETGFMAALSIEPIRQLLTDAGMMPRCQEEFESELLELDKTQRIKDLVGDYHKRLRDSTAAR